MGKVPQLSLWVSQICVLEVLYLEVSFVLNSSQNIRHNVNNLKIKFESSKNHKFNTRHPGIGTAVRTDDGC